MNAKRHLKVIWVVILAIMFSLVYVKMNYYNDVVEDLPILNSIELETGQFLKNVLELEVPIENSLFFLDTLSLFQETEKIGMNPRAACAIESAARWHPSRSIFILYTTHGLVKFEDTPSDKYIQLLSKYQNIHFGYINIEEYGKGSPLETIIMNKTIESSEFKVTHTSDLLRILTLWKYGGIYLDSDVIVLKSFDELAENFFGAENKNGAASGVLGFSYTGVGHDYISSVLEAFAKNYNAKAWVANGPALFTDLAKRICKVDNIEEAIGKDCDKLHIYPPEYFYPVFYPSWRLYFEEQHAQKVNDMIKNSYAIHVWNKLSSAEKININSNATYLNLARKNCPRVISAVKDYF